MPATLVATVGVGGLILPPWDESLAALGAPLVMSLVFGAVAGFSLPWVARNGRARLEIDPRDGRVRAIGRRWSVPTDRPAHARAVRPEKGPMVRAGDSRSRRTWIIRLACAGSPSPPRTDADAPDAASGDLAFLRTLELLRAWTLPSVRARAERLAEALEIPPIDEAPAHRNPGSRDDRPAGATSAVPGAPRLRAPYTGSRPTRRPRGGRGPARTAPSTVRRPARRKGRSSVPCSPSLVPARPPPAGRHAVPARPGIPPANGVAIARRHRRAGRSPPRRTTPRTSARPRSRPEASARERQPRKP